MSSPAANPPRHLSSLATWIGCYIASLGVLHWLATSYAFEEIQPGHLIRYPPNGACDIGALGTALGLLLLALGSANGWFAGSPAGPRWQQYLGVVAAVGLAIGFLCGTEACMKSYICSKMMYRPDPQLGHALLPCHANAYGLSYGDLPLHKAPNEFRFMVIGDSTTYGVYVGGDQRYVSLLEQKLQKAYPDKLVRVIPVALPGYSVLTGLRLFERVKVLDPDDLIIGYNNDTYIDWPEAKMYPDTGWSLAIRRLLYESDLYLALRKTIVDREFAHRPLTKPPPGQRRLSPEEITACYTQLLQYCRRHGHPGIMLSMPHQARVDAPIEIAYKQQIQKIAADNQAIFVDAYHDFRDRGYFDGYFIDAVHPTPAGHVVLADLLYDAIVQHHLISGGP